MQHPVRWKSAWWDYTEIIQRQKNMALLPGVAVCHWPQHCPVVPLNTAFQAGSWKGNEGLYMIAWGFNFLLNSSEFLHEVFTEFSDKQFLLKLTDCSHNPVHHLHRILQNFLVVVELLFLEIEFLFFNDCVWNHLVVRMGKKQHLRALIGLPLWNSLGGFQQPWNLLLFSHACPNKD